MDKDTPKNDTRRNKAYSKALGDLKAQFPAEWEKAYEKRCGEYGVAYKRRLTPKERAEEQIKALLAEYPDLAPGA